MNLENILYSCSLTVLLVCVAVTLVFAVMPISVPKKFILFVFKILIFSLAVFSFYAEPSLSTDLYRHYQSIQGIRDHTYTASDSRIMIIWRFILHIVAYTSNNGWLPFITILIWGWLVYKILKDYLSKNEYKSQAIFLYCMSLFSGCSFFYLITGIRCTLVCAIIAYANYFYRKQNRLKYWIIVLLAAFIHIFALLLVIIIEIYDNIIVSKGNSAVLKTLLIFLAVVLFINTKLPNIILGFIPGAYGKLLLSKWEIYMISSEIEKDSLEASIRLPWVSFWIVTEFIQIIKSKGKVNFFSWIVFVTIALSPMNILFERFPYLIGICSLESINEKNTHLKGIARTVYNLMLYFISFAFLFYFMYLLFAHVSFNGYNYYYFWRNLLF